MWKQNKDIFKYEKLKGYHSQTLSKRITTGDTTVKWKINMREKWNMEVVVSKENSKM